MTKKIMLEKIISGGQTGADMAGLIVGKKNGITTGGTAPPNWLTEDGPDFNLKDFFGLTEYVLEDNYPEKAFPMPEYARIRIGYVERTGLNVKDSDGTIRFALKFESAGEKCTLRAILKYNKPYFDVNFQDESRAQAVADWIVENNIKTLNIAGNRETTCPGMEKFVTRFLANVIAVLKNSPA